ncbi:MAG: DUF2103 domain-containing protein [Gracilibacteraceae bacterium]|jgi:hypothetical protein|nr:DUF2103 domain-containing protein [Gracilibacteraceae bacterium]
MKYRHNKIKREHHLIDGALELLESLSDLDVVTDIIPGVISVTRAREKSAAYQYETETGCKLLLKGGGAVQEVFVVTEYPELVREWAALVDASRSDSPQPPARRLSGRPQPAQGALIEEKDLTERSPELRGIRENVKMVTINQKMRDAYVASLAGADSVATVGEMVPPAQAAELRRRGAEARRDK